MEPTAVHLGQPRPRRCSSRDDWTGSAPWPGSSQWRIHQEDFVECPTAGRCSWCSTGS
jgi:hypothetical protein